MEISDLRVDCSKTNGNSLTKTGGVDNFGKYCLLNCVL